MVCSETSYEYHRYYFRFVSAITTTNHTMDNSSLPSPRPLPEQDGVDDAHTLLITIFDINDLASSSKIGPRYPPT